MTLRPLISAVALLCVSSFAFSHDFTKGSLHVNHPYARATVPNQPTGAAYFALQNSGKDIDTLIALSSPVAKHVDLHTMSMDGNMMKMREVDKLDIKPGGSITMKPGDGYHVMLTGLKKPLKIGDKFPMTLTFQKAGKVKVSVWVEDAATGEHKH